MAMIVRALQFIEKHAPLFSLTLSCTGWLVAAFVSYHFAVVRAAREKAEQVYEEVAVMVETGLRIREEINESLHKKEPSERRLELWTELRGLQRQYAGNASRLQFLLNKYFGPSIASGAIFALDGTLNYDDQANAESIGDLDHNVAAYDETWLGENGAFDLYKDDGIKWKMMSACGMNVTPFIREMRQRERQKKMRG